MDEVATECTTADERDAGRPELSGETASAASDDGAFVVHYTLEGEDAIDAELDGDVPVAVRRVLDALTTGRDAFVADGWREPVPDDGTEGSSAIDLYLRVSNANGYAHPISADGPGDSCWLEVDPGLEDVSGPILESVAVHELHHCVQYAYTSGTASWMYEATATYAQYDTVKDPLLEGALGVLWAARLSQTDRPIDDVDGQYEYAGFVWIAFWEQFDRRGGDPRGPALWEALEADPDWRDALDSEADRLWGLDLDDAFLEHSTWNTFACARDDGAHYDESLPCMFDASVPITTVEGDTIAITHTQSTHTTAHFSIAAAGDTRPIAVDCAAGGDDQRAGMRLLALDVFGNLDESATSAPTDGDTAVRLQHAIEPDGTFVIVSTSTGDAPVDTTCTVTRVDPVIEDEVRGCSHAPGSNLAAASASLLALRWARRRPRSAYGVAALRAAATRSITVAIAQRSRLSIFSVRL